ncbi:MAG: helix-turn-helix transcriptional regulator [Clostridia bacterium]|nr:helix-turn-helix transcriptional regulator [Clostridia bacterium]
MLQRDEIKTKHIFMHHTVGDTSTQDFDLHCHSLYEVVYFEDGDVVYLIEGKEYRPKPYSVLLIGPNVFHGVKIMSATPYKRYVLHFSEDIVPEEIRKLLLSFYGANNGKFYYENISSFRLREGYEGVFECRLMPDDIKEMSISIAVQSLLAKLLYMSKTVDNTAPKGDLNTAVSDMITYLNENICTPVSLDFLSKKFYISKHHLNKVFRKATGTTVGKYINYKRVTQAQQLINKGYSASRAAIESGFGDYSSFYRAYTKLLGHVPSDDKTLIE